MKSYLFTYSQACTQAHAHAVLNDTEGVQTWVAPFPYAAILVSKLNTQDLSAILRERLPDVWFAVAELNPQTVDGWLPGNIWQYVNNPRRAWSRQLFRNIADAKYLRRPVSDADRMAGHSG